MWRNYPHQKQAHALVCLRELLATKNLTAETWNLALDEAVRIQEYVRDQVYLTRKKDYDDPFRQIIFRNAEEMQAVMGTPETNSFVRQVRQETAAFAELVAAVKSRG